MLCRRLSSGRWRGRRSPRPRPRCSLPAVGSGEHGHGGGGNGSSGRPRRQLATALPPRALSLAHPIRLAAAIHPLLPRAARVHATRRPRDALGARSIRHCLLSAVGCTPRRKRPRPRPRQRASFVDYRCSRRTDRIDRLYTPRPSVSVSVGWDPHSRCTWSSARAGGMPSPRSGDLRGAFLALGWSGCWLVVGGVCSLPWGCGCTELGLADLRVELKGAGTGEWLFGLRGKLFCFIGPFAKCCWVLTVCSMWALRVYGRARAAVCLRGGLH
jgi:hypothetical protein